MNILPAIPRDPAARFRLLSLWFALFANLIELAELALGSTASPPARVVGVAALLILGAWQLRGHRRRMFPKFSAPFEAVLLVAVGAASSMPLRAMGVFLAALQFRALYVTRREYWLLPWSYGAARALAIALSPAPRPYGALSFTVVLQIVGLIIISGTLHLLVAAMDRQAETDRALQRSEERYRVLAAATHDMVYDWNMAADIVEHSDAIRSVFGFTETNVARNRLWWLTRIHPDDRAPYDAAVRDWFADASAAPRAIRYRVRRADGSEATVIENAVVQRDATGSPARVIGSVRDVTAEYRLEEQLLQARKMEAIGQLAGGVAHDFNNLLTVIGGHVFMLEQSGGLGPAASHSLDGIMRAAGKAGSLTRQLLAFGRRTLLKPTVLNLNAVISDAVRLIEPVVGERVRVVTSLDPLLAPVMADAGQLEQVLLNLAINARDAMPDGGTLTIATTNVTIGGSAHAQLTLSDTGAGMDAETLAHLFEPFFTTKSAGKGTGLGLATAYGVIKQSFGDITVHSTLGNGSTFKIVLPIAKRSAAEADIGPVAEPVGPSSSPSATGPQRVLLLVEDDDGVRGFALEVLTRAGFQVLAARHGLEGIAVAKAHSYAIDLVVTDVIMPEMGGRQMVEQLRRARPALRVLFISGYADDAATRRELGTGEEALLEKPFTARTLRDAAVAAATN